MKGLQIIFVFVFVFSTGLDLQAAGINRSNIVHIEDVEEIGEAEGGGAGGPDYEGIVDQTAPIQFHNCQVLGGSSSREFLDQAEQSLNLDCGEGEVQIQFGN